MEENKKTAIAGTMAEMKETTQLTSKQLVGLKDSDIALLLYYLIDNASDKSGEEIEVIGKMLSGYAIQSDKLTKNNELVKELEKISKGSIRSSL